MGIVCRWELVYVSGDVDTRAEYPKETLA
jgi:hypothetical protein